LPGLNNVLKEPLDTSRHSMVRGDESSIPPPDQAAEHFLNKANFALTTLWTLLVERILMALIRGDAAHSSNLDF
jgi:hypothetical protein